MSTIQSHYERLKEQDRERWNALNSDLGGITSNKGASSLNYFTNTVLRRERNSDLDLRTLQFHVADCLVRYLGFTYDDIRNNRIPELPTGKKIKWYKNISES
ncbi:hypothetical protein [Spirosoma pomorum]